MGMRAMAPVRLALAAMQVGHVVVVPVVRLVERHVEVAGREAASLHAGDAQPEAVEGQPLDGPADCPLVGPEVEERPREHVSGNSERAVQYQVARHGPSAQRPPWRTRTWLMRLAW